MSDIKAATKDTPVFGFVVDGSFFEWEVLEEISSGGDYFFMSGSTPAEPLVKAGLATWSAVGDGSIRGTDAADELYAELRPTISDLVDAHYESFGGGKPRITIHETLVPESVETMRFLIYATDRDGDRRSFEVEAINDKAARAEFLADRDLKILSITVI